MQIRVNNKNIELESKISLLCFLENSHLSPEKTVVSINEKTLSLDQFEATILEENDEVELFSFVGGG